MAILQHLSSFALLERTKDGHGPSAGLIFDASGNLYGTTSHGGSKITACFDGIKNGCGTIFELTPKAGGGWTEKILHHFRSKSRDGFHPPTNLIFDSSGNLFSTTSRGGAYDGGTVFELTPKAVGSWADKILYSFN